VNDLRKAFKSDVTQSKEWRLSQLEGLQNFLSKEESKLYEALVGDLGKCKCEAYMGELSLCVAEIKEAIKHLSSWMKPEHVSTPLLNVKGLSSSLIQPSPYGVVLLIAPWNYPVQLVINPLVGAIAAGNCVLIKPSELAVNCSKLFAEMIPKYLDTNCIKVIEGAVEETTEILKHQFDYIFYTGNPAVGKVIMRAASEHLTPVTLELGGKNPTFIDETADLVTCARRIVWGKTFNVGQTCLAPDYLLVPRSMQDKVVEALQKEVQQFFNGNPHDSTDFGRIIHKRHVQRLAGLLSDQDEKNIVTGGPKEIREDERYVPPTILRDVNFQSRVMQDEIFGPIIPVVPIDSFDAALEYVNSKPHPLALYIFTGDSKLKHKIINSTRSGSVVVNDVMMQAAQMNLPFGGVGQSGMGAYHGKRSFDTFSHQRAILDKTTYFDLSFRYPPYTDKKINTAKLFL